MCRMSQKPALHSRHGNIHRLNTIGHLARGHSQQACGFCLYPTGFLQRRDQSLSLIEVLIEPALFARCAGLRRFWQIFPVVKQNHVAIDESAFRHHRRSLKAVFQFTHVSRPAIAHQQPDRAIADAQRAVLVLRDFAHQKMRQLGNVLLALAERGQGDRHHIEAVVEIFAKIP